MTRSLLSLAFSAGLGDQPFRLHDG